MDHLKHNSQCNTEASDIGSIAIPWSEQRNKSEDGKITSRSRLECRRTIRSLLTGVSVQSVPVQSVPTHHCYTVRPEPALPCFALDVLNCLNSECCPDNPTINEDQVKRIICSFLLDLHECSCGNLKIIRRKLPSRALKLHDEYLNKHVCGYYSRTALPIATLQEGNKWWSIIPWSCQ